MAEMPEPECSISTTPKLFMTTTSRSAASPLKVTGGFAGPLLPLLSVRSSAFSLSPAAAASVISDPSFLFRLFLHASDTVVSPLHFPGRQEMLNETGGKGTPKLSKDSIGPQKSGIKSIIYIK